jgi:hypothetical protein
LEKTFINPVCGMYNNDKRHPVEWGDAEKELTKTGDRNKK